jgi:hypothetical protein
MYETIVTALTSLEGETRNKYYLEVGWDKNLPYEKAVC